MKTVLLRSKCFFKSIRVIFVLFLNCIFSLVVHAQQEQVLPTVTVIGSKGDGDSITQRSTVEWLESNDPTIVKESDGSYTVGATTDPYSLKSLILASGNPSVNIDLSYAKNSVSMTADGRSALATLLESLRYLGEGSHQIQLTPLNTPKQADKSITQRRVDSLKAIIQNRGINLKVASSKILYGVDSKSKQTNNWRIRIRYQH